MTSKNIQVAYRGSVHMLNCIPMKAKTLAMVFGLALVLPTSPAWAAGGSGEPWLDFLYKSINAVIFFGLIFFLARKPVREFFRGAARESQQNYADNRAESDRIAAELEAQRKKLVELENELKWMIEEAKESAEDERKGLEAQAAAQAERIKLHSREQVEQEMHKARLELKAQLANQTVDLAEKLIRGQMDSKKQENLVHEFIDQVESN